MSIASVLKDAQKFVVAASGAVAEAVSLGLLHGTPERWVTGVISVATAFLVYAMPNGPKPEPKHAAPPAPPAA